MIILLGLPKSGTSSFQKLFAHLKYSAHHWAVRHPHFRYIGTMIQQNKIKNKPLLNEFQDSDVITQMDVCVSFEHNYWPQILDFKQIHAENPDSVFILNKRPPEKILNSFKNWKRVGDGKARSLYERLHLYNTELVLEKTDKGFIQFVNQHYAAVESYFSKIPSAKFLSYDIENDKLEKLKKYIDIKDLEDFPRENRSND
tara:strand:+ start:473 stop:1072 length:600 start_codon:yes stop_codon:yes gene_type:complete